MYSGTGDRTPTPLSNSPPGERATAALDYVNATPLELSGVRTSQHRSPIPAFPKGREPFKHPQTQQVGTPAPGGGLGRGFGVLEMTLAGSYLLIREHVPIDT